MFCNSHVKIIKRLKLFISRLFNSAVARKRPVRHVVIITKISRSVKNNSKYTTGISVLRFINLCTWEFAIQAKMRSYGNTGPHSNS